jgi:hypothetical protein
MILLLFLLASVGLANVIISKSRGLVTCWLCAGFWSGLMVALILIPYSHNWQGGMYLMCYGLAGSLATEAYSVVRNWFEFGGKK